MGRTNKILLFSLLVLTLHWQCITKYNSPYTSPVTGYLVVEGYISGNGPTQFSLSRTIPLPGDSAIPMETGAKVQVEGTDNSVEPLTEQSHGIYVVDTLTLNPADQYRLRINTAEGEQYLSDYVAYTPTPPIDSVNWVYNSTGVTIYANTHDPTGNIRYFQWNYTETWQYTSAGDEDLIYVDSTNMLVPMPPADDDYNCYITDNSSNIILGNSAKLAQATIYEQPINFIPIGTQRLSVLYHIVVRQYALTEDAYNFLYMMDQNTESLGSIFDVTPSQLIGNIQCLTNPNEPVMGYVSAGTVHEDSIFIGRPPNWPYLYICAMPDHSTSPDSAEIYFSSGLAVPIYELNGRIYWNNVDCIDCRFQGGTTQRPSSWPL